MNPRGGRLGRLAIALGNLPTPSAELYVWRAVIQGRDPRDSSRSQTYAGRQHDPRLSRALYMAEDEATAVAELRHWLRSGEVALLDVYPFRLVIPRLLDLTNPAIAARLPVRLAWCLEDTAAARQRGAVVGGNAFKIGFDAIRAPSTRGTGACVCYFESGDGTVIPAGARHFVRSIGEAPL